jgi:hypothetical protein
MTMNDQDDLSIGEALDFEKMLSAEMAKRMGFEPDNASDSDDEPDDEPDDDTSEPDDEPARTSDLDRDESDDDTSEFDDEDESDDEPIAARLSVPIPGSDQTFDVDVDTASRLLSLAAWAENLPDPTRQAFAAIEAGVAVPVERAQYERFLAWQQTHGSEDQYGQYGQDDETDPTSSEIAALRAEVAQMRRQPLVEQYNRQAEQATDVFVSAASSYADQHGLSEAEMAEVFEYAIKANVIPNIAESMRTYSPTGQLVRDADYNVVASRAFDFALVSHPRFRERAFTGGDRTHSGPPQPDPTAIKKARAGSLASAPSAAVTTPPIDVRQMSESDRRSAMAEELRAAMSGRG